MPKRESSLAREVKQVEKYEYLLVEYIKEISNELTYMLLITTSLFLFVLIDIIPGLSATQGYMTVKVIFVILIAGGFGMFGLSNVTKRRIEKRFEQVFAR
ncbi:hypothetical protein HYS54_00855 [Candidatus Micrarchaeota archaeon]|nr:hypothetical protein [Candidatus Micrarchaeota archaeon]